MIVYYLISIFLNPTICSSDDETTDIEMHEYSKKHIIRTKVGALPITMDNRVVFVTNKKTGKYELPSGKIKVNETSKETAIRETIEKAGMFGSVEDVPFYMDDKDEFYVLRVNKIYDKWYKDNEIKRVLVPINEVIEGRNNKISKNIKKKIIFALKVRNVLVGI